MIEFETGVRDIFERKHPRTGVAVSSLMSVFHQLDMMTGRVTFYEETAVVPQATWDKLGAPRAHRPTPAELHAFPLTNSDYTCASRPRAEQSLQQAYAQHAKGWLTDLELKEIEKRCLGVIALFSGKR